MKELLVNILNLMQYDRASLLAGKLHAILARKYTKGRDLYDLAWYLASPDWPEPNLTLLNNALAQTEAGAGATPLTATTWRSAIAQRLETVDWQQAQADVSPFLERSQEVDLISQQTLTQLLTDQP